MKNISILFLSIYGKNNRIDHNHIEEKQNIDLQAIQGLNIG